MPKVTLDTLDKWLITAMSYMKTDLEDAGIPWPEEDEIQFKAIRNLITVFYGENGWQERAKNLNENYLRQMKNNGFGIGAYILEDMTDFGKEE